MGGMGGMELGGAELVMQAVKDLPPNVAADPRGFLLRCAVPGKLAAALLGNCAPVEKFTGARIRIPGKPDERTRVMSIEGPLLNACAAYILMMVQYVEAEEEAQAGQAGQA
mmetsp:Transcript_38130/g.121160  ORF Transcript_38130/g.121160 Transcript_38130/m.121160 type:complete len:111 (-) Transcript_38130:39-371(-)